MVGEGGRYPIWVLGGAYHPPQGRSTNDIFNMIESGAGAPLTGAALTVALDVVQAWAVLITLGFTLILFFFLAFCVCAKKDDSYDEFEINRGITTVKICHDGGENGVSLLPRLNGTGSMHTTDETSESSSRCTLKRELPAIPTSAQPDQNIDCRVERTASQHSSELYAAVGDPGNVKLIGGVQVLPSNAIASGGRAAVVKDATPSTDSDQGISSKDNTDNNNSGIHHPYAKVKKDHPYAHVKLPKKEHPYAKVGNQDSEDPETDTDNYEDPKNVVPQTKRWSSEAMYEPAPQIPEKRFEDESVQGTGLSLPAPSMSSFKSDKTSPSSAIHKTGLSPIIPQASSIGSRSSSAVSPTSSHGLTQSSPQPTLPIDIPAAMAISGRTPANEELPYMTPPLMHGGVDMQNQSQNFSGDSQDSRGYTSISVREPLAALKAQSNNSGLSSNNQPLRFGQNTLEGEGYYMTVSDDSADETYACIYEGSRGTTGSETYAQIEPRNATSPAPIVPSPPATPSPLPGRVTATSQPPPAPPSVDSLKHVVHSRQASSSSAASTVMGSPVAEKRGTKSPLPPLPQGDTSLYSSAITTSSTSPSTPQPPNSPPKSAPPLEKPTQRALEEMYAKVMKKQTRSGHNRGDSAGTESDAASVTSSRRGSTDVNASGSTRWTATPPSTPRQSQEISHSFADTYGQETGTIMSRTKSYDVSSSWSATSHTHSKSASVGNYETITQSSGGAFYSGESTDPEYETVKNTEPPYASVERREQNYPGYEIVKVGCGSDIDSEPGYEILKHQSSEPGYETVPRRIAEESEPGYETVNHRISSEPGYETVKDERTESNDPGYESVREKPVSEYSDPGYELLQNAEGKVQGTSEHDPNYEQLKFVSHHSSEGENDPKYEVVRKAPQTQADNTYERVSDFETRETFPTYEKVDETDVVPSITDIPIYASVKRKGSTGDMESETTKDNVIVSSLTKEVVEIKEEVETFEEQIEDEEKSSPKETTKSFIPPNILMPSVLIGPPIIGSPIIQPPTPIESSDESSRSKSKTDGQKVGEDSQNTDSAETKSTSSNGSPIKEMTNDKMESTPKSPDVDLPDPKSLVLDVCSPLDTSTNLESSQESGASPRSNASSPGNKKYPRNSPLVRSPTQETYPLVRSSTQHESPPMNDSRKLVTTESLPASVVSEVLKEMTEPIPEEQVFLDSSLSEVNGASKELPSTTTYLPMDNNTSPHAEGKLAEPFDLQNDLIDLIPASQIDLLPAPLIDDCDLQNLPEVPTLEPQISSNQAEMNLLDHCANNIDNIDDLLPPPPLPSGLDFEIASSPPPPPPPCDLPPNLDDIDQLVSDGADIPPPISETPPLPPMPDMIPLVTSPGRSMCNQTLSDMSSSSICGQIPPPLPTSISNGSITVTVNPMAEIDDFVSSSITNGVGSAPHKAPTSESQSSGSTNNGSLESGSVESVVNVNPTSPPPQPPPPPALPSATPILEHSSSSTSTSSSESKHIDPNEGITPV